MAVTPKPQKSSSRKPRTAKRPAATKPTPDMKTRILTLGGAIKDAGTAIGQSVTKKLESTERGQQALWVGSKAADALKSGAQVVAEVTGKVTDNISGADAHARIVEFVDQQRRYNDILATRLAEALSRIEQLESRMGGKNQ
jgi:hypothetical protein